MLDYNFHLTTPRLYLSYFNPTLDAHCDFLVDLYNSPEVRAANGNVSAPIPDREAARRSIEAYEGDMPETGFGRYLICLRDSPTATASCAEVEKQKQKTDGNALPFFACVENYPKVGIVGLKTRKGPGAPDIPDMGFSLLARFSGQGYATEAARALVEYFERVRRRTEFLGFCNPGNVRSKKMFQRLGWEDRGMREVGWVTAGGEMLVANAWSKGVGELEQYGILKASEV